MTCRLLWRSILHRLGNLLRDDLMFGDFSQYGPPLDQSKAERSMAPLHKTPAWTAACTTDILGVEFLRHGAEAAPWANVPCKLGGSQ